MTAASAAFLLRHFSLGVSERLRSCLASSFGHPQTSLSLGSAPLLPLDMNPGPSPGPNPGGQKVPMSSFGVRAERLLEDKACSATAHNYRETNLFMSRARRPIQAAPQPGCGPGDRPACSALRSDTAPA